MAILVIVILLFSSIGRDVTGSHGFLSGSGSCKWVNKFDDRILNEYIVDCLPERLFVKAGGCDAISSLRALTANAPRIETTPNSWVYKKEDGSAGMILYAYCCKES